MFITVRFLQSFYSSESSRRKSYFLTSILSSFPRPLTKSISRYSSISISFRMKPKIRTSTRAPATLALEQHLKRHAIEFRKKTVPAPEKSDPDKRAQLEAVKRWFHDDWQRIEPKLRTSIVEGISVFLSLFDDNPKVKRVFCPPKECYDKEANADGKYGKPLPSFSWLIETGKVCALNFPIGMNPGLANAFADLPHEDFSGPFG